MVKHTHPGEEIIYILEGSLEYQVDGQPPSWPPVSSRKASRSAFLPRIIGVLLAVDGLAYLCYNFTDILAPGAAAHLVPWIQVPALVGEGALCLWLLVVGLDAARRWEGPPCGPVET